MENGTSENADSLPGSESSGGSPAGITLKTPGKRGRPPGSRNANTPLETGRTTKTKSDPAQDLDKVESAKFIGDGLATLLELVESLIHGNCAKKIEKKFPEKLLEFRSQCEQVALKPKEKELISDCASRIAARHELLTKYAPEVLLAVTLGQYSVRQMALIKFTDSVTKEKTVETKLDAPVKTGNN